MSADDLAVLDFDVVTQSLVAYNGFNPMALHMVVVKRGMTKKEMGIIMTFIAYRGTNLRKIERTNPEGKEQLKKALSKLGVVESKKELGPNDVTLSRLAATYPHVIARVLYRDKSVNPMFGNLDLPLHFQFPSSIAIIPEEQVENWKKYMASFFEVTDKANATNRLSQSIKMIDIIRSTELSQKLRQVIKNQLQ